MSSDHPAAGNRDSSGLAGRERAATMMARIVRAGGLVALGLALGPFAAAQNKQAPQAAPRQQQNKEKPDAARRRMEWFYKQRASPLGFIPAGARVRAVQRLEEMMEQEGKLIRGPGGAAAASIAASTTIWTPLGPQPTVGHPAFGNTSGRVSALAVDRNNSSIVYLGGAQGGVWKTTNAGLSWTPLTDQQASLAIGSIAIAPANSSIIYAGTGEQAGFGFDVYYGAGVLKSTDGGSSWTQKGQSAFVGPFGPGFFPGGGARIGSLAIHPTNPNLVLAGVQIFAGINSGSGTPGIYCTNDGGDTWSLVVAGAVGTEVVYANTTTAYAALGRPDPNPGQTVADPENGIYKSTNADQPCAVQAQPGRWTKVPGSGLPAQTTWGRIEIAVAPSNPNIVYAAIADATTRSEELLGVFKTTDGGNNWTRTNAPDFCRSQCWFDLVLRVHPTDPNTVFAGGSAADFSVGGFLIRSTDGGFFWTGVASSGGITLHVDQHALAFSSDGSRLYIGNDGGAYRTDDPQRSSIIYANLNDTLNITQFYPGHSIHPSDEQIGFGGTQDNGTQRFNGSLPWTFLTLTCGDGGWTAIDGQVPSTVYVTCQDIDIHKSVQNGNPGTFTFADMGINFADGVNFIPPFVIDPNPANSQRLYFGTFRLWQTTDGAQTWRAISGNLTGGTFGVLTAIALGGNQSQVVYTGSDDGRVFMTLDVTASSPSFSNVSTGLPPRAITQVVVDPADTTGKTAYVTFSGFSGLFPNPPPPIGDANGHVFKTVNGGTTWTDVSCKVSDCSAPGAGDLPNTPVNDIVIDPDDPLRRTLYVATDVGVFQTTDGGASWSTLVTGLPRIAVFSLKLRNPSRTLRAATHGRGVWDLKLQNLAGTPSFNLSSIQPSSTPAVSAGFTLTVNGNGFTQAPLSTVKWNGAALPTTFVGASQLTATVSASLVASPGTAQVTVDQSASSGPISNAFVFTITGPTPTIASIAPTSAPVGSPDTPLTVNGTNFSASSRVHWDGSALPTTNFVSSTQLTTTIPAARLAFGGVHTVTVVNPPPGGGVSNGVAFTVTGAAVPSNDNFANAKNIPGSPFSDTVDSSAATTETGDPTPPSSCFPFGTPGLVNNGRAKSVWYKFAAGGNGTVNVDTMGSAYDTILSVWTGGPGAFTSVACNDDIELGVITVSQLSFQASQNNTYFFMITDFAGNGGQTVFNFSTSVAASGLSASPSSATINAGQPTTFTISVMAGSPPFTGNVTLSVSGCPPASTCNILPTSVAVGGTAQLTVTTTARSAASAVATAPPSRQERRPGLPASLAILATLLVATMLVARVREGRRRSVFVALLVLALFVALQMVGCGGDGGGGGGGGGGGTPAGNYTISVTGTSGAVTHNTSVSLTVR